LADQFELFGQPFQRQEGVERRRLVGVETESSELLGLDHRDDI